MQLVKQVEMPAHAAISSLQFAKKRQYMLVAHDHKLSVINITADGSQQSSQHSSSNASKSQHQSFTVQANCELNPNNSGNNQI